MSRPARLLAPLALLAALGLSQPSAALAQAPPPMDSPAPATEDNGAPWYGFTVFGLLAGAILFAVCKTARR